MGIRRRSTLDGSQPDHCRIGRRHPSQAGVTHQLARGLFQFLRVDGAPVQLQMVCTGGNPEGWRNLVHVVSLGLELYICPVFCAVYSLIDAVGRVLPTSPRHGMGWDGSLLYDWVEGMTEKHAILYDLMTGHELMRLHRAYIDSVRGGAVFVRGERMVYRGTKSKGEPREQVWWCVPIQVATLVRAEREAPTPRNR